MTEPAPRPLSLFEAFGVELEYMIVDARTYAVRPIADELIHAASGSFECEIERPGGVSWSNELVNHVVEFKTTAPVGDLVASGAAEAFGASVREANALLAPLGARLMGAGMHPFMDPAAETRLWPHEYGDVYSTFDRLFNCKRHGWANLQSTHLNLPFAGDKEFQRLHAAVRLLLPILPAICASSPFADGTNTGRLCNRLAVYASNQAAVPSLTGMVIPEPVYTRADYERVIMAPIARDVARLEPTGLMQPQWMNSRGAIARFDRGSIEIRVMDVQECPAADLAIAEGVVGVLRRLVVEGPSACEVQCSLGVEPLRAVLDKTIVDGEQTFVDDTAYLAALGVRKGPLVARDLWVHLFDDAGVPWRSDPALSPLRFILERGTLSRRMLAAAGEPDRPVDHERLVALSARLSNCLEAGEQLGAER